MHSQTRLRLFAIQSRANLVVHESFRRHPPTTCLAWSVLQSELPAFRGRNRELSPSAGCGKSARPVR
jgi:hypothetical protein